MVSVASGFSPRTKFSTNWKMTTSATSRTSSTRPSSRRQRRDEDVAEEREEEDAVVAGAEVEKQRGTPSCLQRSVLCCK